MEKKDIKILLLIFLAALFIRIGFILTLDNSVDVWGDWWDELGWKIATGKGYWVTNPYFPDEKPFYSWRTPGFPFFLALIYVLFGHSFLAAKIGLAIVSSLTSIALYIISACLINRKAGLISAGLFAIYPVSVFWTGYLAPETLTTFLTVMVGMLAVLAVKTDNSKMFFLAGLAFGLLFLTRPTAGVFLPVLIIYFFLFPKRVFKKVLIFCCGCLIIVPWIVRNYVIHHRFILASTEGGVVFYIANNEHSLGEPSGFYHAENIEDFRGLSEVEIDRKFYRMGFDFVRKNPGIYLKLVIDRFARFWRFFPHTISGPGRPYEKKHVIVSLIVETPLIIIGFIGFFLSLRRWKDFFLLHGFIITFTIINILIRTAIRYRFPIMPFVLILFVYTVMLLLKKGKNV